MKIKDGMVLIFRGCSWDEPQWEFDAPCVLYTPIKRYGYYGGIDAYSVFRMVEEVCIDACIDEAIDTEWDPGTLKEFKWRGWSPNRFNRRKNAIHAEIKIRFYKNEDNEFEFEIISACELDKKNDRRIAFLEGVQA